MMEWYRYAISVGLALGLVLLIVSAFARSGWLAFFGFMLAAFCVGESFRLSDTR